MNPVDLHYKLALGLNQTYIEKNADYGDAFDKSLDNHGLTAAIVRMEDKMGRFSNLAGRAASMQVDESLEDTLLDLANYAIMTVMWIEKQTVNLYADNKAYTTVRLNEDYDGILAKRELAMQKLVCGSSSAKEFVDELVDIQGSFNNRLSDDINAKADKVVENFNKKMDSIMQVTADTVLADVKNMEPITGYHGQVRFLPAEPIMTDFNRETNQYLVGLGKTTWGAYSLVDQTYIIETLKEFKNGKLDDSIAWEHIQRFIVTK